MIYRNEFKDNFLLPMKKAKIHDPYRFSNSHAVEAYLGMTPTQYSSGEVCKQSHISRCGLKDLRSLSIPQVNSKIDFGRAQKHRPKSIFEFT